MPVKENRDTAGMEGNASQEEYTKQEKGQEYNSTPSIEKDIAVIGISCRFPGANNYEEFRENLEKKRSSIQEIPKSRFDWELVFGNGSRNPGKGYGGFIENVDAFDASFFGISGKEAECMDPQQRLMLELAWACFEDAGISREHWAGKKIGNFIGVTNFDYKELQENRTAGEVDIFYATATAPAVTANRISYLLNLKGPSVALDAACSSSLNAIHLAVQSILDGESEMALAGAISLLLSPSRYASLIQMGILSPTGSCKTFDDAADGYVRSEGAGMILLKPLQKAIEDKDPIYGIIKGSAVNHSGKTYTLTYPSADAQAEVLIEAYKRAGVTPDTISYIELHGTGTPKGDPIELQGLLKAFAHFSDNASSAQKKNYCGLASVKTNIGHTESAAGIAGVIKVLLAMKSRCLFPMQNFTRLNHRISLDDTPFYIVDALKNWDVSPGSNESLVARRAGVSSFGFGGTNAHVILEEYISRKPEKEFASLPALILLSARDKERLKDRVRDLKNFLEQHPETDLQDLAYTLQMGRESMADRLALLVNESGELMQRLARYLDGQTADYFISGVCGDASVLSPDEEEAASAGVRVAIEHKDMNGLARLWVQGRKIDWNLFYGDDRPNKIALPSYPFSKERYWLPELKHRSAFKGKAYLHPLLHENESDLSAQRYSSIFTGEETFFADHQVQERKVFPGAAYLEMAREAGQRSIGRNITQLRDVLWLQPIHAAGNAQKVSIAIYPSKEDVVFEVYTESSEEQLIHSQGTLSAKALTRPQKYDIHLLQSRLGKSKDSEACYASFRRRGLQYGSSFRGIEKIYYSREEALSRIQLTGTDGCMLSPGMLDSALQTCLALGFDTPAEGLELPYGVNEVNIYEALPASVWCYVRRQRNERVSAYDLDILNEQGEVLVGIKGFVLLPANRVKEEKASVQLFSRSWQAEQLDTNRPDTPLSPVILIAGAKLPDSGRIKEIAEVVDGDTEETFFLNLLGIVKEKTKTPAAIFFLYRNSDYLKYAFVSGLFRTICREIPNVTARVIGVDDLLLDDPEALMRLLEKEVCAEDAEVRYTDGRREVKVLQEFYASVNQSEDIRIKEGGVYLITGGAGGLGRLFAKHIGKTKDTRIILTGRKEQLKEDERFSSGNVEYYSCDVSKAPEVELCIRKIREQFGRLDGIIHAAGVIRDAFVQKKTAGDAAEVLRPKIAGIQNIDEATKDIKLDFMVLFSSIAGVMGNAGQADYASANAYLDNYALHRNALLKQRLRSGRTLSIQWPLWSEGGMHLDAESEAYLEKQWGMKALPSEDGIVAFEKLLKTDSAEGIVVFGKPGIVKDKFVKDFSIVPARSESSYLDEEQLRRLKQVSLPFIKRLLAKELKLDVGKFEPDVPFEKFGIDSILINKLSNQLGEVFGKIPKTLFFEYHTLHELLDYFVQEHTQRLQEVTGFSSDPDKSFVTEIPDSVPSISMRHKQRFAEVQTGAQPAAKHEDIAIIGISGRYPGARNLDEFWENLKQGKDSITEIPADRWDIGSFYDKEKGKEGKSYSKWGGFIEDIDKFDPLFFNISPREAEMMDPQERLFLQTAWEAMEDAGYTRARLQGAFSRDDMGGRVGVYAGVMYEEYQLFGVEERHKGNHITPGGNPSSIANRVSYFFNFHGPSMAVDTMCSSSLTAIHLAVKDLQLGEIDVAIAGGVNVTVHPGKYYMLSQGRFVSSKGRCESFGEGGEGYVPAEGVGVVLLKPLSKAEADGDRIYGVIKGIAVNHGGKTNGYTVPNPNAQAAVIREAMQKAGVKPEDISYIEAHGTGTSLGDPIEIAGLTKAFRSDKKQFCRIGSVKSNIGHCESAAGISGLTKVLLQFKYKQLVPSLHSSMLNPNIDFEESPFKVQQELESWDVSGHTHRLAGISSFGAGGSNGHIIVQEYSERHSQPFAGSLPAILVLSAQNEERLRAHALNLKNYLEANRETDICALAYTLQTGREAMDARLALLTMNTEEAIIQLSEFLQGKAGAFFKGNVSLDKSDFLIEGEAGRAYIESALRNKESKSLAQLWVKGVSIDWELLYPSVRPARISLPTYPFAKERCWIPEKKTQDLSHTNSRLHPLLHSNESDLSEQKYRMVFTGEESFLKEHQVRGEKILPGVAYLEMAREAGSRSIHRKITRLQEINWLSPVKVKDTPEKILISVYPCGDDLEFEVYPEKEGEAVLHCRGILSSRPLTIVSGYDLASIRGKMHTHRTQEDCYRLFEERGLKYGSGFQGIRNISYNEREALSEIQLSGEPDYELAPGIMDSALQSCMAFGFESGDTRLALPFSVKEVCLYNPLPEKFWCYVRKVNTGKAQGKSEVYHLDLLNEAGEVLVHFEELVVVHEGSGMHKTTGEEPSVHLYGMDWKEAAPANTQAKISAQLILLAEGTHALADKLKESLEQEVEAIHPGSEEAWFIHLLERVKARMQEKDPVHITVVCKNSCYKDYAFVSGLLKTAKLENPKITGKVIGVDSLSVHDLEALTGILENEKNTPDAEVRYVLGKRQIRALQTKDASLSGDKVLLPFREQGVYLITGGAGGLGRLLAAHILKTRNAKVVLTGRSAHKAGDTGLEATDYFPCDVAEKEAVVSLIKKVKEKYGKIDGIIHSAGVTRDSFLLKKTAEEAMQVLAPKIAGVKNLDEATKEEPLEFMVFFSSLAGVTGNAGQADYASANAYLDLYAEYRNSERAKGHRYGDTLSINWPLWAEGGMHIDAASLQYLEHQWGLQPLPSKEGIEAFETLMKSGPGQSIVIYGRKENILIRSFQPSEPLSDSKITSTASSDEKDANRFREKSVAYIRSLLAQELKLAEERLELNTPFEKFGIDSILITRLINRLSLVFENLPRTLFFECQTLGELVDYFMDAYSDKLSVLTGKEAWGQRTEILQNNKSYPLITPAGRNKKRNRFASGDNAASASDRYVEPIAIIGISGRYPGARNIEEFWENLKQGKDSITEIPSGRWDMQSFYDGEKGKPGKSYSKWGGFIEDVDKFDPLFFNISPAEAETMDPQERLFLQAVWEAVEDAGYTRARLQETCKGTQSLGGQVGVYAGVMYEEYQLYGAEERLKGNFITPAGSPSSIANRVSYFFNFHGPSMAVDTMCSSSLTAIHLACESLRQGQCSAAIAGGVNVSVHPNKYLLLSQGRFVSGKGRCESFGEGGEGYVPSEGVGAVLLKRLSEAEADGDRIYGIIRGTALNHGGKTNGYTVPNPHAQAAVIREAMDRAGVKAEDFSYIEAHGTGTSLGDPIEIAGLSKAFQSERKQYCRIGSVKSNIGHCESAAGISGVTKVLLQMKHKQLVPSLHSQTLNPHIRFSDSPFVVQQELESWETESGKRRLAGVSSFGAGGSNAHVILEEYVPAFRNAYEGTEPVIVPLSAKNGERLREYARYLKRFLVENAQANLYDVSFTLQQGREAMEERLAIIANDREELLQSLTDYTEGRSGNFFTGNIKKDKTDFLLEGGAGKAYIQYAIENKEIKSLVQLWTKGVHIDWTLLYPGNRPQKISLPTYPFAKDRYWIAAGQTKILPERAGVLHPLIHTNKSTLKEQRFESRFTGKEDLFSLYNPGDKKLFPGMAYIEMARAAGVLAAEENITSLKDLCWINPFGVKGTHATMAVRLYASGDEVGYEMYEPGDGDEERLLHYGRMSSSTRTRPGNFDVSGLRQRLGNFMNREQSAVHFRGTGKVYDTEHSCIDAIYYSEEKALSKIRLTEEAGYVFHPVVLEGALQACVAAGLLHAQQGVPTPARAEEICLFTSSSDIAWCYAEKVKTNHTDGPDEIYNVSFLTDTGEVILTINGLVLTLQSFPDDADRSGDEDLSVFLSPAWESASETGVPAPKAENQIRIFVSNEKDTLQNAGLAATSGIRIWQSRSAIDYIAQLYDVVKEAIRSGKSSRITILYDNRHADLFSFAAGLFRTFQLGNHALSGQVLGMDADALTQQNLMSVLEFEATSGDVEVRYVAGKREISVLKEVNENKQTSVALREGGVYIITGGTGGLGKAFAEYLGKQGRNVKLILTGRSLLSEEKQAWISGLKGAVYYSCDVSDRKDLENLIRSVKAEYGQIHGIIHSAGVAPSTERNALEEDALLSEVLLPKIKGTEYLDELTSDEDLDFMVYFSSISGTLDGVIGLNQADYALANAYLNSYSRKRNEEVRQGTRKGKTISINWPMWRDSGMYNEESHRWMEEAWGIKTLPVSEGLSVFSGLLQMNPDQVAVLYGQKKRLTGAFAASRKKEAEADISDLKESIQGKLIEMAAGLLKLGVHEVDPEEELGRYGFESVSLTQFSKDINDLFDLNLNPTVFYNYPSITRLASFLSGNYPDKLLKYAGDKKKSDPLVNSNSQIQTVPDRGVRFRKTAQASLAPIPASFAKSEPVAIVGISGRFPGSPDPETFWKNLKENKDLITEVPSDRWDWRDFYGDPQKDKRKTKAKWGGFLDDVDKFDPLFFGISPREAELMDPQQRIALEAVYHALEDAGINVKDLSGSDTGIFLGSYFDDYAALIQKHDQMMEAQITTGLSHSMLVNRISYLFNFHGSSEPVDTACSSSLVAIHRGVEHLRNGSCGLVIAGGLSLDLIPENLIPMTQAGMLSEDGRCKTFDQKANGYVRGEGIGIVILKSLSAAERDGNPIYGIIRGTAENHGGKANTLTSPNPNAQKELLIKAYRSANVDPREVTYIEAHGTGTPLGDPIEIEGLKLAFSELYKEKGLSLTGQYCGIGSVKTNIGHLEAAAGIAGVMKVLLSMKYKQLPGNPHLKTPNEYLRLSDTPFYLLKETKEWTIENGKSRIAGISSFGFGGVNAHVILEEYIPKKKRAYKNNVPVIVPLSSKNEAQLQMQAENLLHFLKSNVQSDLSEIAYTLQLGREPMEERLALVADTKEVLEAELEAYLRGSATENCLRGNVRRELPLFSREADSGQAGLEAAIHNRALLSIARLWVRGASVDWHLLWPEPRPDKISLPGYPFARERYWIPEKEEGLKADVYRLHPLLHVNESDLNVQKYSSEFTGSESFLKDHQVHKEMILPATAYLELAREAGARSVPGKITRLKDVVWLNPLRVEGTSSSIYTAIYPSSSDSVHFEIYSGTEDAPKIHSRGSLFTGATGAIPSCNIASLLSRLPDYKEGEACYSLFRKAGLDYGPAFRGIERLYYSTTEVLSRIVLNTADGMALSPGLLDSALQSCLGLSESFTINQLALPYSVREVNIYQTLPGKVWAYVRRSEPAKSQNILSFDIDVLNDAGEVLLQFNEFVFLPVSTSPVRQNQQAGTHIFSNQWIPSSSIQNTPSGNSGNALVLLANSTVQLADKLKERLEAETEAIPVTNEESFFIKVFEKVKIKIREKAPVNILVVCTHDDYLNCAFVSGLLKTAASENPMITGKILCVDSLQLAALEDLARVMEAELQAPDTEVRYRNGIREVKTLQPVRDHKRMTDSGSIREGGIYLITGGAGGLGRILAADILKVKDTQVILTGRGVATGFTLPGTTYYPCDAGIEEEVRRLICSIRENHGPLNGVIHCAGVVKDAFILRKTQEEIREVFSPKIKGVHYLDEATRDEPLDFMVYFSSISSVTGNAGQSDYASANAYLNNFAVWRNAEKAKGLCQGKTLSINWPLWKDGGMKTDAETLKYLERYNIHPLPAEEGTKAFGYLLANTEGEATVVYGKEDVISAWSGADPAAGIPSGNISEKPAAHFTEASKTLLRKIISGELKLPESRLETDAPFEKYGIDSMLINRLTNRLSEVFGKIPRTLFFEYQTLGELADYFAEAHADKLKELTSDTASAIKKNVQQDAELPAYPVAVPSVQKRRFAGHAPSGEPEPIAIIGLSGRYPGARNISEFWENLKQGVDSISEIPATRWNTESMYDSEKGKEGKSYSKWGGFIEDVDKFDPLLFNISPKEAEMMDPQERLFLQAVWETLEDAGYTRKQLSKAGKENSGDDLGGKVGVYAGVMYEEYQLFGVEERMKGNFVTPSGSPSSIANRVSYFFNLHGPSMAVDTMCSSSLTAIHLACESIRNGHCALAIAGGVNVSIHPNKYLLLSQGRFVSSKGRCESFGEGGEGYVPAEGVGAVLLKPLSKAEADGDRIYGVIKGTAVNHGGKTNGVTVPNPNAQASVIKEAMQKAGVQPEAFSYIEAHGTGTSLGDPIEIAGLAKAFRSVKKQFCSIGSVKSNIGHCESAAGISGVTKVLLQLKYRQLVPSLHSRTLNPGIDFENSPFKVQQQLEAWQTEGNHRRLAGISSFGAGGSNAHVIIEEYIPSEREAYASADPSLIVISGKNRDRLKEHVRNLKKYFESDAGLNIYDVAYTLQQGREPLEERLAMVVMDLQELILHLESYLLGKSAGFLTGNIKKDKGNILTEEDSEKARVSRAIQSKDLDMLAQLWVSGVSVDWDLLYAGKKPDKVYLPYYPFAKDRYWIPAGDAKQAAGILHPLLHANDSDLMQQKFSSVYSGSETFLSDHVVRNQKILPGVAYLEMAREAGSRSLRKSVTGLRDILWLQPVMVNQPQEITISVHPSGKNTGFRIYSSKDGQEQIHGQGMMSTDTLPVLKKLDRESVQSRLKGVKDKEACYRLFLEKGLQYGKTFQGIEEIYYGSDEALSRIVLPIQEGYVLTPGILDSALQTCIGVSFGEPQSNLSVPFSLASLTIYAKPEGILWCWARRSTPPASKNKASVFNIDVMNEAGEVLLQFKELAVLPVEQPAILKNQVPENVLPESPRGFLYTPSWKRKQIKEADAASQKGLHLLITGDSAVPMSEGLKSFLAYSASEIQIVNELTELPEHTTHIYFLQGMAATNADASAAQEIEKREISVFRSLKLLQKLNAFGKSICITFFTHGTQKVLSTDQVKESGSGIVGLAGSLAKEQPQWKVRIIDLDVLQPEAQDLENILKVPYSSDGAPLCYRRGHLYERNIHPIDVSKVQRKNLRMHGTYVILGGAGGIGRVTTEYLVREYKADVIWLGRSPLNEKILQAQEEIARLGVRPSYICCDANDKQSMEKAYRQIKQSGKKISGLFHSAIVLNDKLIANMSEEDFKKSFMPKSLASHHFVEAFKGEPLDFVCFYSSTQSQFNAPGQANYAAGCTYKDSYAQSIRDLMDVPAHIINWGYWGDVGIVSSGSYRQRMEKMGVGSISAAEGMHALEQVLAGKMDQVIAIKLIGDEAY